MERKQTQKKQKVEFILGWPPSENQLHAVWNGRKILTKKTRDYYKASYYDIYTQCGKIPKFYNKVTMLIEYYPKRKSGWDVNNFRKAPEDAIVKAGVIPDDQVKYLQPLAPVIHKADSKRTPYIKITLTEI